MLNPLMLHIVLRSWMQKLRIWVTGSDLAWLPCRYVGCLTTIMCRKKTFYRTHSCSMSAWYSYIRVVDLIYFNSVIFINKIIFNLTLRYDSTSFKINPKGFEVKMICMEVFATQCSPSDSANSALTPRCPGQRSAYF